MQIGWMIILFAIGLFACDSPSDTLDETRSDSVADVGVSDARPHRDAVVPAIDAAPGSDATIHADALFDGTVQSPLDARPVDAADSVMDLAVDKGPSDVSMDARTELDGDVVGSLTCPGPNGPDDCVFGATSRQMVMDETLHITQRAIHLSAETMSPLETQQLVDGFTCDGLFMPRTVEDAFELIDQGRVQVFRIRRVRPLAYFTWFKFYMGDTEVGYVFLEDSRNLAGLISDQELARCTEARGNAPLMNCPDLDVCLQTCEDADIECRRPCIRGTAAAALEAYITLDECRGDCAGDAECLQRVCGDEFAACFGP